METTPRQFRSPATVENQAPYLNKSNASTNSMLDKELLKKLDGPWKILKNGTMFGIGGIKRFSVIVLLFAVMNLFLFGIGMYTAVTNNFSWSTIGILFIMILLGSAFTLWAGYRSYRYVFINILSKIYENTNQYQQNMCAEAVLRAGRIFSGEEHVTNEKLEAAVDWGNRIYDAYGQIPVFFQSGITQLLKRIPVTAFLLSMKEDIKAGNNKLAADKLHALVTDFINAHFFSTNNTRWLLWLIPLNVILMAALALYGAA